MMKTGKNRGTDVLSERKINLRENEKRTSKREREREQEKF